MSVNHEKVEALFNEALKLAPGERSAYLAGACGSDVALRRQLEELLRAEAEAGGFLPESPNEAATVRAEPQESQDEALGSRISHYKLLQKVGEGGCGVVYMAEQEEPVRRRVALKVIKLGMDTRSVVARFEAERQALAMMDHPNIAKVLDAGTTEKGRPFFVMELVRGIKITDYCDQNHLTTEARLELFIKVCQAVQHAHQKGIIHRDLKPSNILVTMHDGVPVPKVIDFGIAKAIEQKLTEKTLFTELHQFMGTPAYMSPEQAEMTGLDIDTRSDIYSLGVLLYELLTGRTPFDAHALIREGLDAIRRTIREVEPPRPSTSLSTLAAADLDTVAKERGTISKHLRSQLTGDLDWIVMKALEKDRTRRYETANGFAQDLRRHLTDEPVTARAPSAGYKLQKAIQRNKLAFTAAGIVAAVLLAGVVTSTWLAVRATRAESLASRRLAEAESSRSRALAAEQEATAKATTERAARAEAESITRFMMETFRSPDPTRDGHTITVAETLTRAVKQVQDTLAGQPRRQIQILDTLGSTYRALGLFREAIPLQEKVRDYQTTNAGPEALETLSAMGALAWSYRGVDRLSEAIPLEEERLRLSRMVLGPEHRETRSAMLDLATCYHEANRGAEALALDEEACKLYRKVCGPEDPGTLSAMNNLAQSYFKAGRQSEALKMQEQLLQLRRKVNGAEHPDTLYAIANLARTYRDAGRRSEALALQEQRVALSRKAMGAEHPDTFDAMRSLAISYSEGNWLEQALKLREEILQLSRKVHGPEHRDTLGDMTNLAISYGEVGRLAEAITLQEQALTLKRRCLPPDHDFLRKALSHLAELYMRAERKDEALKLLEDRLTWCRQNRGTKDLMTLDAMTSLGQLYSEAGRPEAALKLREEVLPLSREVRGPEDPATLGDMTNLAIAYSMAGRLPEAIALQEQTVALKRRVLAPSHPFRVNAVRLLAILYGEAGRNGEAPPLWEEVLTLRRQTHGPEHPDTLIEMHSLAGSYSRANRPDDALKTWEELLPLSRKVMGPEHTDTVMVMQNLVPAYMTRGSYAKADPLINTLLPLKRKSGTNDPARLESCLADLADLRYRQRQFAAAESAYREIIQSRQRPDAEPSDAVISATASLGRLLTDWAWAERVTNVASAFARAREGEALVRQGIAARSARTNSSPRQMADLQSRLGGALCVVAVTDPTLTSATREPRLVEAETFLRQGHTGMERDQKTDAKYLRDGIDRLIRLYEAWGRPEKLAEWRSKLEAVETARTAKDAAWR